MKVHGQSSARLFGLALVLGLVIGAALSATAGEPASDTVLLAHAPDRGSVARPLGVSGHEIPPSPEISRAHASPVMDAEIELVGNEIGLALAAVEVAESPVVPMLGRSGPIALSGLLFLVGCIASLTARFADG